MLEILERKPRESASEYARRVLEYNIIHLKLLPGEQLQEKALAVEIGVSRTPVREAILELKRRNILNIYPQRGTFVSFLEEKRSEDIRYLRFVFEPRLAEEASSARDPVLIADLRGIIYAQKLTLAGDPDRFLQLDDRFHEAIYRSLGREDLYRIVKEHSIHFDRTRRLSYQLNSSASLADEHEAIAGAIEAGNACMDAHGGYGFAEEYDIERKFRESRLYRAAPINNNLVLAFVGEHVLGMPRSY
jgi:DNA-binding GntR family transcriptional regulator